MPFVRDDGLGGERTEPTSLFKRITTLRGRVSVRRVRPSQYHVCVQELTIRAPYVADRGVVRNLILLSS